MAAVSILGAGAWGTAVACALAPRHEVVLWLRDPAQAEAIRRASANARYLPGIALPPALSPTSDLDAALAHATGLLVMATPTAALRELAHGVAARLAAAATRVPLVWLCKGFERSTSALAHEVVRATLGEHPGGPLSGPSFAIEVARGQPTALTVAGPASLCDRVTAIMHGGALRIYATDDVIGVEVGGAVKNVLAIAAGIADALDLGHNARAALLTRGLAEITRLGVALGARAETFMGLTGLGDLILTATSDQSRNRQVGLMLGRGMPLAPALDSLGHVAEGVWSAPAVARRAQALGVEMPITQAVCAVLDGRLTPTSALEHLLARDPKRESSG